jgi:hypothetical protein
MPNYERIKEWRKNTKIKLVEGFGSKCACCGIEDDAIIYDFHHLEGKDFGIASKITKWEKLVAEAKKCVLLCSHCHRKVHFRNLEITNPVPFNEDLIQHQKNNRHGFISK